MDPQPPPNDRATATPNNQHHHARTYSQQQQYIYDPQQLQQPQRHSSNRTADSTPTNDYEYAYSEKDVYPRSNYDPRAKRSSKYSNGRSHDSVISNPPQAFASPKPSSPPSPSSSISSVGRKHRSIEEVQRIQRPSSVTYPPRAYIDPEKAAAAAATAPSSHGHRSSHRGSSNPDPSAVVYDSGEYHEKGPEEKPWQLLLYLSAPCVLLSFVITLWTIFSLFIALLLQPFRLFSKARPSLSQQLITFLAPPLNLQLHLIYSFSSSTDYSPAMLVVIHLFSPVVAAGVAISAWTAACFWFFSAILGDPAGQDGRNDGKESILGVRNWWDRWLSRGLR